VDVLDDIWMPVITVVRLIKWSRPLRSFRLCLHNTADAHRGHYSTICPRGHYSTICPPGTLFDHLPTGTLFNHLPTRGTIRPSAHQGIYSTICPPGTLLDHLPTGGTIWPSTHWDTIQCRF